MSAFYINLLGPIHWLSKWQSVTAGCSAEAEIYATDVCVKILLELAQIMEFLEVRDIFMPHTTTIYNDNRTCVQWLKCTTTKGLWHIQMKENRVWENILSKFVDVCHVEGKVSLANIFTKKMKDTAHFIALREMFMKPCPRLWIFLSLLSFHLFEGGVDIISNSFTDYHL